METTQPISRRSLLGRGLMIVTCCSAKGDDLANAMVVRRAQQMFVRRAQQMFAFDDQEFD